VSRQRLKGAWLTVLLVAGAGGCTSIPRGDKIVPPEVPIELNKVTLPEHLIEAPDILQITAINALPRRPYKLQPTDTVSVSVPEGQTLPGSPLTGLYIIDPEGFLDFGPIYKRVQVANLTVEEAQLAIKTHLMSREVGLKMPDVTVSLVRARAIQQIAGEHLVRADGTIYLGTYGSVYVSGLRLSAARQRIEEYLSAYLHEPKIAVDVLSYNSKSIYVIFDGAGAGQQVYRLPVTGNETVLDAISQVNGLGVVSDKNHIWVARPTPKDCKDQVLPVDWNGITTRGKTATNYQLLPGDRLFVKAYTLSTVDNALARIYAPFERTFGILLLGTSAAQQLVFFNQFGQNGVGSTGSVPGR
jgi:polysaccharide export outer membrane protein